jgi:hypothetical protein
MKTYFSNSKIKNNFGLHLKGKEMMVYSSHAWREGNKVFSLIRRSEIWSCRTLTEDYVKESLFILYSENYKI